MKHKRKTVTRPWLTSALESLKFMAVCLATFMAVRIFAVQTFAVISGSMEQTFLVGDFLVVSKVAYGATLPGTNARLPGFTVPKRGDIVVFHSNHDDDILVKRLIALPGDTIAMRAGRVILNGIEQAEPYVLHLDPSLDSVPDAGLLWHQSFMPLEDRAADYFPTRATWGPIVVPARSYFMLGDNRDRSYDSRWWGFMKHEEIIGRGEFIYFSFSRDVGNVGPRRLRLGRIGGID